MATPTGIRWRRSFAERHALESVEREIRATDSHGRRKYLREFVEAFRAYEAVLSPSQLDTMLRSADVLLVGDYHALPSSQRYAASLVEQLAAREPRLDFADLNWRRLTPVRRALQDLAGALPLDALAPPQIRIACRRGDGALAWLLGGWLAARLGWPAGSMPRIEEASAGAPLVTLAIGAGAGGTTVALTDDRLVVTPGSEPPYTSAVPRERDAEAIAAELRALAPDRDLRDVVDALRRAFSVEARS